MLLGACTGSGNDATPPSLPVVRIEIVAVPEGPGLSTDTSSDRAPFGTVTRSFVGETISKFASTPSTVTPVVVSRPVPVTTITEPTVPCVRAA